MRRRWKIFLLSAYAVIAILALCFFSLRDKEPSYNGRTLSDWLFLDLDPPAEQHPYQAGEAKDAIRKIGTAAVPLMVKWMRDTKVRHHHGEEFTYSLLAQHAFMVLGTNAGFASADLARIAADRNAPEDASVEAARTLPWLGSDSIPIIISFLNNRTNVNRNHVASGAHVVRHVGHADASQLVSTLVQCTRDEDEDVATAATRCLGNLNLQPGITVPALINAMIDQRPSVRIQAMWALCKFTNSDPNVRSYVTALSHDRDATVRVQATNALNWLRGEPLATPVPVGSKAPYWRYKVK